MGKRRWLVVAIVLLLASACNGDPEVTSSPEASPAPSPAAASFQLEGTVIEASGSAKGSQGSASPKAAATASAASTTRPGAAASPGASASASAPPPEQPAQSGTAIEQGAPGSLALKLTAFSGGDTCVFSPGDTVVVLYTRASAFEPGDVTSNDRFPNNLVNSGVSVAGKVLEKDTCVLVANSVSVNAQAQPGPTASASGGVGTTRRASPAPARRATTTTIRRATTTPPAVTTRPTTVPAVTTPPTTAPAVTTTVPAATTTAN